MDKQMQWFHMNEAVFNVQLIKLNFLDDITIPLSINENYIHSKYHGFDKS